MSDDNLPAERNLSAEQIATIEARIALLMRNRMASRDEIVTTINRGIPE